MLVLNLLKDIYSMNKEDCQGCKTYYEGVEGTCLYSYRLITVCPCIKCIVKGICSISCEDYDKAHGDVLLTLNKE